MESAQRRLRFILLIPLIFMACSKDSEKEKPATQIAAKVNAGEISVHQINYVLSRTNVGTNTPEAIPKIRKEILNRLVDQELAVEQAIEKKLDRSPEVLMAIENARREILARAYIEQITAGLAKPTPDEAKKYYAEHPQLFAERRIYNLQEIAVLPTAGVVGELRELVSGGKSLEDIANWLKNKDIKFSARAVTRPAEQIPLELLPKIHPLQVGQGLLIESPQAITIMRLAGAQLAPVSEEVALPRIQQFLGNQRATEAAKQELKELKAKAKIAYMGEFAEDTNSESEESLDNLAISREAAVPAPPAEVASEPIDSKFEKGISGLR